MKKISLILAMVISLTVVLCVKSGAEALSPEEAYTVFEKFTGLDYMGYTDCYTSKGTDFGTVDKRKIISASVNNYLFSHWEASVELDSGKKESLTLTADDILPYIQDLFGKDADTVPTVESFNIGAYFVESENGIWKVVSSNGASVFSEPTVFSYPDRYEITEEGDLRIFVKYVYAEMDKENKNLEFYTSSDKVKLIEAAACKTGTNPDYYNEESEPIKGLKKATLDIRQQIRIDKKSPFASDMDKSGIEAYKHLFTEYVMTYRKDANGNWYWLSCEPTGKNPDTSDSSLLPEITATVSAISVAAMIFLYSVKKRKTAA